MYIQFLFCDGNLYGPLPQRTEIGSLFFAEWELYQEPVQLLSFMEILPGLKEGKRYKRKSWNSQIYVDAKQYRTRVVLYNASHCCLSTEDLEAKDWILGEVEL